MKKKKKEKESRAVCLPTNIQKTRVSSVWSGTGRRRLLEIKFTSGSGSVCASGPVRGRPPLCDSDVKRKSQCHPVVDTRARLFDASVNAVQRATDGEKRIKKKKEKRKEKEERKEEKKKRGRRMARRYGRSSFRKRMGVQWHVKILLLLQHG